MLSAKINSMCEQAVVHYYDYLMGEIQESVPAEIRDHINQCPYCQSEIDRSKVLENCEVLSSWSYGWDIKPIILDHSQLMAPIVQKLRDIGEER